MNTLSLVEKIACLSSADKEWLERLIDRFLVSPQRKGCDCHIVDPKKQDIIIWPSQNPKHPNDLIVQFTNQKFIGMPRVDKRGEKYWKVRDFYENERAEITPSSSAAKLEEEIIKTILDKPINEQTAEDREKWAKWTASKEKKVQVPENVPKEVNNHES